MALPIRRVVTGKNASGKAVAQIDGTSPAVHARVETGVTNTLLWVTDGVPVDLSDATDAATRKVGVFRLPAELFSESSSLRRRRT